MKTINMLVNEIKNNEALQKLLADAAKNNALDAFLKEQGVDATAEEFIAALKDQGEELDDDALDAVAGGEAWKDLLLSLATLTVYCGAAIITSAVTDNPRHPNTFCEG